MDVFHPVDQAGRVVNVLQPRGTVGRGARIEHGHGLAAAVGEHLLTAQLQVMLRVPPMEHHVLGGRRDHVLHQRARKAQPAVLVHPATPLQRLFLQDRDRVAHADIRQDLEHGVVNLLQVTVAQGPVPAADLARIDGGRLGRRRATCLPASAHVHHLDGTGVPFSAARRHGASSGCNGRTKWYARRRPERIAGRWKARVSGTPRS